MNELIKYTNTNDIMGDVCNIIESAQRVAIQSANISLVLRNSKAEYCVKIGNFLSIDKKDF